MTLTAPKIIEKKRNKKILSVEEIEFFIQAVVEKKVDDAQIGAFLMASYLNGLNRKETSALTNSMLYSGHTFNFKGPLYVDKHSTGGVGDKTSFILGPIAAACGVKVPMIAGRGLGHTGGTIDKIESLKGFQTQLTVDQYKKQLKEIGIVLIGQTSQIAPADRKIYSIRDVTATVSSIPLITASIMSKKLAEGANGFVFDVKFGNGAFMRELSEAKKLAKSLALVGNDFQKPVMTFVTDMNQVLGNHVGNSSEIIESINTLKGEGPVDLTDLSVKLAAGMILLAGKANDFDHAVEKAYRSIENGSAYKKFEQLIAAQGGDINFLKNRELFPFAKNETTYYAPKSGYISEIDAKLFGDFLIDLKGGRQKSGSKIDHSVGLYIEVKTGNKITKGQPLFQIFHHKRQQDLVTEGLKKYGPQMIKTSNKKVKPLKLIREIKEYLI